MGKIIVVSLNLLFLISYKFFFGGDVTVTQKIPDQIMPGETFTVEVTIEKGDREGFAKWQQELPEGFIATAYETKGATFSFKKQNVKLIWMALPKDEVFTISYEITCDPELNGAFDLQGKFSFIDENERKDIASETHLLTVGSGGALASDDAVEDEKEQENTMVEETEAEEITEPVENTEEAIADATEDAEEIIEEIESRVIDDVVESIDQSDNTQRKSVTESNDITIEREIIDLGSGQYKVNLYIDKNGFNSFGKVEEYIPEGFIASENESKDGMFSFNRNVMKILWMALPEGKELAVSYRLESTSDDLDEATVHGVFSFLRDDESKQLVMNPMTFANTYGVLAMEAEKEEFPEEKEEDNEIEETEEVEMIAEVQANVDATPEYQKNDAEAIEKDLTEAITNVPAPNTGINYRVQIAAAKREVTQDYFVKRHSITEEVMTEYHSDWYKYTIGGYDAYRTARDKRNEVWAANNKINDAFVTAYNSGERISVQEALMISKQKWVK